LRLFLRVLVLLSASVMVLLLLLLLPVPMLPLSIAPTTARLRVLRGRIRIEDRCNVSSSRFGVVSRLRLLRGGIRCEERWNVSSLSGSQKIQGCFFDGKGTEAAFNVPMSLSYGKGGLFVCDTFNHCIRKVSQDTGEATVWAGTPQVAKCKDGHGSYSYFNTPHGIAQDAQGSLYVADWYNHKIRKVSPTGKVTTFAGGGEKRKGKGGWIDGHSLRAAFKAPTSVAVVDDIVYVADSKNCCVRKIQHGKVSVLCGGFPGGALGIPGGTPGKDGFGTLAKFACPRAIVANRNAIYVTDISIYLQHTKDEKRMPHVVRKITPDGEVTRVAGGTEGDADGRGSDARFKLPMGIALGPSGHLYIADTMNHKIRRLSPRGKIVTLVGSGIQDYRDGIGVEARLHTAHDVTVDPKNRQIYIADSCNGVIRRASLLRTNCEKAQDPTA